MQVTMINNNLNNRSLNSKNSFRGANRTNFTGRASKSNFFSPVKKLFSPVSKLLDKLQFQISRSIVKLLSFEFVKNIIMKASKAKNLVSLISASLGLIIGGLYIKKTLHNEKLDKNKRRTLAINQGLVTVAATVLGLTVNGSTEKAIDKFANRYAAANVGKHSDKAINTMIAGIHSAKTIMIFGLIYRFLSPVFVTPIANKIGNKIEEKEKLKESQMQYSPTQSR